MRPPALRPLLVAVVLASIVAPPVRAVADADPAPARPLRWQVGVQSSGSWRSRFDVFDRDGVPPGAVAKWANGGGVFVGRRFGDRFVGQLLVSFARHDIEGVASRIGDVELLLTGTVLLGPERTVQPFLRGGIGGGGQAFETEDGDGNLIAFGPAAIAGGGAQLRLGRRVSLELEAVGTFTNFLQVDDLTNGARWGGGDWQVRTSNWGWRLGVGWAFWF
ncbi:MAG: hypothetical protein IPK64_00895 [bacterium]|nr:hypothetical protein [bacterium]